MPYGSRPAILLAAACLLLACGGSDHDQRTGTYQSQFAESDTPIDLAAINKELEREYKQRVAATGKYADCMKKTEGHEKEQADLIAKACARMPDAPR